MLDQLEKDYEITHLSNFKTKAFAQYFYEIKHIDDVGMLYKLYKYSHETGLWFLLIWWGTNILFAFDRFDGIVIKNSLNNWWYESTSSLLSCQSNSVLSDIAQQLELNYNQTLWHRFIGLPGSVWWAVFWNAWCFGLETQSNFKQAKALNLLNGDIEIFSKEEMNFDYRTSIFKKEKKYFIIEATFDLSEKKEKYHSDVDNLYFREHKQPKWNTCGSFFKNPDTNLLYEKNPHLEETFSISNKKPSAGFLLEVIWYKGKKIKSAYFSQLHANFLMSEGIWNYKDLLNLIESAQMEVHKTFWIDLTPEVRIIYN